ncbi:hypothetical protein A9L43_00975 [Pseudomonas mosselii]|nr:hypothetical protein A9L43_00975 [Pseudomonas mosselii]
MVYLNCGLMDLCVMYVRDVTTISPDFFGLESYSERELLLRGFDRVGDVDDYCLYEMDYRAVHGRSSVDLSLKCYFYKGESQGVGISLAPGARLITLLKQVLADQPDEWSGRVKFYFYEGEDEGAVIIDNVTVIRFGADTVRSAYHVRELESDQRAGGEGISIGAVKKTMQSYGFSDLSKVGGSLARFKLFEFLSK